MRKLIAGILVAVAAVAGLVALSGPSSADPGTTQPWVTSYQVSVVQSQPGQTPANVPLGCGNSPSGVPYAATGGGYRINSGPLQVIASEPTAPDGVSGVGWRVTVDSTAGAGVLTVWAVCIDPTAL